MKLLKLFLDNLKNKITFFSAWKNNSTIVENWFSLYLITTSLILQLLSKIGLTKQLISKLPLHVKYRNGGKFSVFFDKSNELHSFIHMYKLYFDNFKKYTGKTIKIESGDCSIDLGGHVGSFSLFFMLQNPHAKLYTYEADLNNYCLLKKNFEDNSINKKNYKVENYGVYGEETILNFTIGNTSTVGSISDVGFFKENRKNKIMQIKTKTLLQIFQENAIDVCKILKMDIEGSEYSIFYNMENNLFEKIENMILEVHPTQEYQPLALKDFLEEKGFVVKELAYCNGCYDFYCYR